MSSLRTLLPQVDKDVLTDEFGEDMVESFHEALRTGVDGWLDDDLAFTLPWGFDLDEISIPTALWQGNADLMVPFARGEWLAAHVAGAAVHLEDREGHLSVGIRGDRPHARRAPGPRRRILRRSAVGALKRLTNPTPFALE